MVAWHGTCRVFRDAPAVFSHAVAGAIIGAAGWHQCDAAAIARNPDYCRRARRENDAFEGAAMVGVLIGIPVGGVVGAHVKTDTWADIPFKPVIAALRRD